VYFIHEYQEYNAIHKQLIASIGVDLAGLLGGRMASAEGGSVPSGVVQTNLADISRDIADLRK